MEVATNSGTAGFKNKPNKSGSKILLALKWAIKNLGAVFFHEDQVHLGFNL